MMDVGRIIMNKVLLINIPKKYRLTNKQIFKKGT